MKKFARIVLIVLAVMAAIWFLLFTPVDRSPYDQSDFYREMDKRLDSLEKAFHEVERSDSLLVGWSKVSITPAGPAPLAGYSNRKPKEMERLHDSIFVRTVVFRQGENKVAFVSADLLIFHPAVTDKIIKTLPEGFSTHELYLTTTHTHSSLGAWAPGLVGEAIAGPENDTTAQFIADQVILSIKEAGKQLVRGQIGLVEMNLEQLVHNRLVHEEGTTDPWLKSVLVHRAGQTGILNFFSAHATCLNSQWRSLSGDFPGQLNSLLEADTLYDFTLYGAGAVGSMGPVAPGEGWERVEKYAHQLKKQMDFLPMIVSFSDITSLTSFHLPLPLREPYVKITENWAIRPYIFKKLAGDYNVNISVFKLGSTLFVGIPADFSGELAVPLYQKARELGLNLVITSFNGGYIGYVVKDDWYDLSRYESRSMSWYGPDNGAYLSEIIERILHIVS
ncbi:MAG: neutral/alkaline non-lysosomal ceramidase N-terminal domain-containing protein [Cyclobacteriaceae bacterium]